MSVRVADRKESGLQFLENAMELEIETIRRCEKIPTRYTLTLANRLIQHSIDAYDSLKSANSIFPQQRFQAEERRKHIDAAYCSYQCLISQVGIVKKLFPNLYTDNVLVSWMELINKQFGLLKGLKESDKKRFASLYN